MANGLPPIPPTIAQLTGPVLIGHLFNWYLFGVLTVQSYVYYLSFPRDKQLPKGLVASVFFIELLQTVLSTRDAFRNFGTGWGNIDQLNEIGWLWFSVPVLGAIISCIVQVFYAWRIYILSRSIWIPSVVIPLSLVQTGAGIWGGGVAHHLRVFSDVQVHTFRITSVWLGGTALCDVIIAIYMLYYLSRARTGFEKTNLLLKKIIRITIETGFTCAIFAIIDLSLFLRFQTNNYHLAPSIALSKLYSNSLLVVLNSRMRVVNGRGNQSPPSDDYSLSYIDTGSNTVGGFNGNRWKTGTADAPVPVRVGITHECSQDSSPGHSRVYDDQDSTINTITKRNDRDKYSTVI